MTSSALHSALMIAAIVLTATAGDVLTASAMRKIGDLDVIRAEHGLTGAIRAVVGSFRFLLGVVCMALSFLLIALCGEQCECQPHSPGIRFPHLREQCRGGQVFST